ncbi:13435_t:CDS:2 [Ambispora gerdemannii]|uniref:13435_t:CDS:1 n=1 Tax=Ambispora gerdemannii TaxID=144530 RepID=A0A9N8ZG11_9GLOM|nr:13435_t:CDS:2 [Ambispora gerdemannii]
MSRKEIRRLRKLQNKKLQSYEVIKKIEKATSDELFSTEPTQYLCLVNVCFGGAAGVLGEQLEKVFREFGGWKGWRFAYGKPYSFALFDSSCNAMIARNSLHGKKSEILNDKILYIEFVNLSWINFMKQISTTATISSSSSQIIPPSEKIQGLIIMKEFISFDCEQRIIQELHSNKQNWQQVQDRMVQHFGYTFTYPNKVDLDNSSNNKKEFPEFMNLPLSKLKKLFPDIPNMEQMTAQLYPIGAGIPPHVDSHLYFGDFILSLSLQSAVLMEFKEIKTGNTVLLDLSPRSLLILSKESRYAWTHTIRARKCDLLDNGQIRDRKERISLTLRTKKENIHKLSLKTIKKSAQIFSNVESQKQVQPPLIIVKNDSHSQKQVQQARLNLSLSKISLKDSSADKKDTSQVNVRPKNDSRIHLDQDRLSDKSDKQDSSQVNVRLKKSSPSNQIPYWVNLPKDDLYLQKNSRLHSKPESKNSCDSLTENLDKTALDLDETVTIKVELQIGDFVEVRKYGKVFVGILIKLRDREDGIDKNTTLLPNGRELLHREDDVSFRIPTYAYSKINPSALVPNSVIPQTYGRVASNFLQASTTLIQQKNPEFRKVYSHFSSPDDAEHSLITVEDVARFVFKTEQPQTLQLFAAHSFLLNDGIHFVTDPASVRIGKILLRPKSDVQAIETVLSSIRLKDSAFNNFLAKARSIIQQKRVASENHSVSVPSITQSKILPAFSSIDKLFIRFIRTFIFSKETISQMSFDAPVSAILKPLKLYEGLLDRDCAIQFMIDIGMWAPWENLSVYETSMELNGHGMSKARDEAIKHSLNLAKNLINTRSPFRSNYDKSKDSPLLIKSLPNLGAEEFYPRDICEEIRYDFGDAQVYTIDDIKAHEIDDGVSIERINPHESNSSGFWVHVHIADPSAYIHPDHQFAKDASRRVQTVYFPERVYPMIPAILSEKRFSLGVNAERSDNSVMSFSIKLSNDGQILDYKVRPGIIRRIQKLNYDAVDTILSWDNIPGGKEEAMSLRKNFYFHPRPISLCEDIKSNNDNTKRILKNSQKDLLDLQKLTLIHMRNRIKNGGFNFSLPSCNVSVSPSPLPITTPNPNSPSEFSGLPIIETSLDRFSHSPSRLMVAELMIMAGRVASRYCAEHKVPIIFRNQQIPNSIKVEKLLSQIDLNTGCLPPVTALKARSIMSSAEISTRPGHHWVMGILDGYSKVTSPLRRYSDLVAHWQIKASLLDMKPPFSTEQISQMLPHIQYRERESKKVDMRSTKFWVCMLIKRLSESNNLPELSCISLEDINGEKTAYGALVREFGINAKLKTSYNAKIGDILKVHLAGVFPFQPSLELIH